MEGGDDGGADASDTWCDQTYFPLSFFLSVSFTSLFLVIVLLRLHLYSGCDSRFYPGHPCRLGAIHFDWSWRRRFRLTNDAFESDAEQPEPSSELANLPLRQPCCSVCVLFVIPIIDFGNTFVYVCVCNCVIVSFLQLLIIEIGRPLFRHIGHIHVCMRVCLCVSVCGCVLQSLVIGILLSY